MGKKNLPAKVVVFTILLLASFSFLYPFCFMFLNSMKTRVEYAANPFNFPPAEWQVNNYTAMINQFKILNLFKNTAVIIIISFAFILAVSVIASYAFAKLRFRFRNQFYIAIVMTLFIPGQVTIIPLYSMFAKAGLINNPASVILAYISGYIPETILLMTAFFKGIPTELIEACRIDGCKYFQVIRHVIMPTGKSAIIISMIFCIIYMWNDLFTPLILLQKMDARTVMVALSTLMQRYSGDPTYQLAGLFIGAMPCILVYIILQKYIVKGVIMGSIK